MQHPMTGRRRPARLGLLALALALAADAPRLVNAAQNPAAASSAGATVKIDNFTFDPAALTVKVGATVTWTNNDDIPHLVVAQDHTTFRSKALDTNDSFSFTFTKAGDYPYFCALHPHMLGKIIVQN